MKNKLVRFLNLSISGQTERKSYLDQMEKILCHGQIVLGPEVEQFENDIREYTNRNFTIGVGSGTDALILSIMGLGIGPGDEIITTPLSWIATANAIRIAGADPVFADIDESLNIDPRTIEPLITNKTKAILAVDYTGKICDAISLQDICDKYGLKLIIDGSQAFGAKLDGKPCGAYGDVVAISHNPMKVLPALGEAGSIVTDDATLYENILRLRYAGTVNKETCVTIGFNARIDTIQAAILSLNLKKIEAVLNKRRNNASIYDENLHADIMRPVKSNNREDCFYTYTIRAKKRDELQKFLIESGIETKVQHRILMPDQPAYSGKFRGNYPSAKKLVDEILCLPIHEKLDVEDIRYVIDHVNEFCENMIKHK